MNKNPKSPATCHFEWSGNTEPRLILSRLYRIVHTIERINWQWKREKKKIYAKTRHINSFYRSIYTFLLLLITRTVFFSPLPGEYNFSAAYGERVNFSSPSFSTFFSSAHLFISFLQRNFLSSESGGKKNRDEEETAQIERERERVDESRQVE